MWTDPKQAFNLSSQPTQHSRDTALLKPTSMTTKATIILFALALTLLISGCVVSFQAGHDGDGGVDDADTDAVTRFCTPSTCPQGCCTAEDVCLFGTDDAVCGADGNPCLNCVELDQLCTDSQCVVPPPCDDGDTDDCGNCGMRTCDVNGVWSSCMDEGICAPSASDTESCGFCGTRGRSCTSFCAWLDWGPCSGGGVCEAGTTETELCGNCGTRTRDCSASCGWDNWSACTGEGVCVTGATETELCGNCGLQTRDCSSSCSWDAWSPCTGEGPDWSMIDAGDFWMGCDVGVDCPSGDANQQSSPAHLVTLSAYCMQVTEVSVADYRLCHNAGVCTGTPAETGPDGPNLQSYWNWTVSSSNREDHPMNGIDRWYAQQYCQQWLGGDLPTEAQWEKAARGTDQRLYPWGSQNISCSRANFDVDGPFPPYLETNGCASVENGPGTWVVGFLTTTAGDSPYGLKDMSGNVGEWVLDCYDAGFYASCSGGCTDPVNLPPSCSSANHLSRGASYWWPSNYSFVTTERHPGPSTLYTGFRCARQSL